MEIYLKEGEVDRALETLEEMSAASGCVRVNVELMPRVARAAEEARPQDAIRLYVETVEKLIAYRGRHNYATAASLLKRVRGLYQRLDQASTWEATIAAVRDGNRRLRALKDELNKAGL
jgi:pentatricopeptide repeat protein